MRGEHLEAGIGVDPPRAGRSDRRLSLERQAGGMGEQVANGRSGRPRRLVERDDPLLGRDEHRDRGRELRHRGPGEGPRRRLRIPPPARSG